MTLCVIYFWSNGVNSSPLMVAPGIMITFSLIRKLNNILKVQEYSWWPPKSGKQIILKTKLMSARGPSPQYYYFQSQLILTTFMLPAWDQYQIITNCHIIAWYHFHKHLTHTGSKKSLQTQKLYLLSLLVGTLYRF